MSDLNDPQLEERPLATLTFRAAADWSPREVSRVARWLEQQASRLRSTAERAEYAPRYRARIWESS